MTNGLVQLARIDKSTRCIWVKIKFSGSLFQLSLDMHYTEDEIYELSLAREPRNSLSSVSFINSYFKVMRRHDIEIVFSSPVISLLRQTFSLF